MTMTVSHSRPLCLGRLCAADHELGQARGVGDWQGTQRRLAEVNVDVDQRYAG